MVLPEWLDLAGSENAAASMCRGLRGPSARWGELIATAHSIIGIYQDQWADEASRRAYSEAEALPVIAASRILDSAAQPQAALPDEDRLGLALASAVTFAMYANFPSAEAVVRRVLPDLNDLSASLAVIAAICAPSRIPEAMALAAQGTPQRSFLESLEYFLSSGNSERIEQVRSQYVECAIQEESPFESSLLYSCSVCLEHIFTLSVARILASRPMLVTAAHIQRLIDSRVRVFQPPQFHAIVDKGLLSSASNAIVANPTSTGKTLLGELCLAASLHGRAGLVCYVAPYVALGQQVITTLRRHLPPSYRVHSYLGNTPPQDVIEPSSRLEVIVATPERLDILIRGNKPLLDSLKCIVFDEAHLLQNDTRGARLEGLLTRLRLFQQNGFSFRIVLLSAVLDDYASLTSWLGISEANVVRNTWRPTARRIAFWKINGQLVWYRGDDPIRRRGESGDTVLGQRLLRWPESQCYPTNDFAQKRVQRKRIQKNIAYLVEQLLNENGGAVLCACATREDTRRVAEAVAVRSTLTDIESPGPTVAAIIERIETRYRFLRPLARCLRQRVAFHNAAVPQDIRQMIGEALHNGEILVIAATSTLAEGVDYPFRFTIIVDWLTWQGATQQPMSVQTFRNVVGRCGRAGLYTEGDTIVFDNPLGPAAYTDNSRRWPIQRRYLLDDYGRGVSSTLETLSAAGAMTSDVDESVRAVLASQFLASIPENPIEENLPNLFARNTYGYFRTGQVDQIYDYFVQVSNSLQDESQEVLAVAASPLRLTSFGSQANVAGLSPDTSRRLVEVLRSEPLFDQGLAAVAAHMLADLGTVPELQHAGIRKVVSGARTTYPVKRSDFAPVVFQWLTGRPLELVFANLPVVARSTGRLPIARWLSGDPTTWDEVFEDFIDFIDYGLRSFMVWLLSAADPLAWHVGGRAVTIPWRLWAEMMNEGVDSAWAIEALRRGAPVDRTAVSVIGRLWPDSLTTTDDPLGIAFLRSPDLAEVIHDLFRARIAAPLDDQVAVQSGLEAQYTILLRNDLRRLHAWLLAEAGCEPRNLA